VIQIMDVGHGGKQPENATSRLVRGLSHFRARANAFLVETPRRSLAESATNGLNPPDWWIA
jgi:hypothetical protein